MANIKLHKFQEELLEKFKVSPGATIRFLDNDISSMYAHTIKSHFISPPAWQLVAFDELDQLQQEDLESAFIYNHQKRLWSEPAAVATNIHAREEQIQEELEWVKANTKSCVILDNCPFLRQHTFIFMDWDDALAFKLAWVDK